MGSVGSNSTAIGRAINQTDTVNLDQQLNKMRRDATDSLVQDTIVAVEQSQTNFDITSIIKKYGGVGADASWANELSAIEKKQQKKPSYLEANETESITSSIQEEAYQRIKQKYATV